jgi:hypothetical protein
MVPLLSRLLLPYFIGSSHFSLKLIYLRSIDEVSGPLVSIVIHYYWVIVQSQSEAAGAASSVPACGLAV